MSPTSCVEFVAIPTALIIRRIWFRERFLSLFDENYYQRNNSPDMELAIHVALTDDGKRKTFEHKLVRLISF